MAATRVLVLVLFLSSCNLLRGNEAADIVRDSGIRGGIVVHLGCGDGRLTADLLLSGSFQVHGLDVDPKNVASARDYIQSRNLYGQVSVACYDGKSLPYADNIVNLIVADSLGNVPRSEILRVLTPRGVVMIGGEKMAKPWPQDIDDWPQYLNNADNNAVARDHVAGPPRHLQWVGKPTWCRSHMGIPTVASVVSGNGRLFSIEDTAPPDNPFLPAAFRVVARDAFNGKQLWEHAIPRWESVTMYIKCQPLQQQRRMVVVGDKLYCTLELQGPLSELDAATGELLRTFDVDAPVQEVAYDQGILFLNVGDRFNTAAYNIVKLKDKPFVEGVDPEEPFYGGGFRRGYAPEIPDKPNPISAIVAVDLATGSQLWAIRDIDTYTAGSLSVKGDRAVYQAANGLFCVDSRTGTEIWRNEKQIVNSVGHDSHTPGTTPNTVVITEDKVLAVEGSAKVSSYADNTLFAYSLIDGKLLWSAPIKGNYEAPSDVFVVNGTVWIGGLHPTQLDLETGEVVKRIVQRMTGPMGHDRCYRNYITERYFINSKTGGADFLDLETNQEFPHHWTRGGCGMGVLPANGLLYSTPYSCQCSMGAMFQGMNAYASHAGLESSDQPIAVERTVRLEKGPAYENVGDTGEQTDEDWPVYRHDGSRSGMASVSMSPNLSVRWTAQLPTRPSAVTATGNRVFVCDIDTHTLYALDRQSGRTAWTYIADGRVDSPPTCHRGRVYFGSRDGWVYCLRASDGALAWRFKDLPDRLIGAYGQLESAWPVSGSVLIVKEQLYFAAGRSSFLDGGIFVYALDPITGTLLDSRANYGPFSEQEGFPVGGDAGFKNDVPVTDGELIYLRQKAFDLNLADASGGRHIVPTGGFLDGQPQHRTCWSVSSGISRRGAGDILVTDGTNSFSVEGFPLYANHSYFDPRRSGYTLLATSVGAETDRVRKGKARKRVQQAGKEKWRRYIPITGKAMAMAGDVLFVAGEPMQFDDPSYQQYMAAYGGKLGGVLLAVSTVDGSTRAEYTLTAAPAWDSIAVARDRLYISLADGTVQCMGPAE